jgi:hypothetical protein
VKAAPAVQEATDVRRRAHRWAGLVGVLSTIVVLLHAEPAHAKKTEEGQILTAVAITLAFAGVGAAIAGGLYGGAELAVDDAAEMSSALAAKGYAAPCASEPEACDAIDAELEHADRLRIGSLVAVVLGSVGTLALTSLIIKGAAEMADGPRQTHFALRVVPRVGPTNAGVALTASW